MFIMLALVVISWKRNPKNNVIRNFDPDDSYYQLRLVN